jgi:hypothetical protein
MPNRFNGTSTINLLVLIVFLRDGYSVISVLFRKNQVTTIVDTPRPHRGQQETNGERNDVG